VDEGMAYSLENMGEFNMEVHASVLEKDVGKYL